VKLGGAIEKGHVGAKVGIAFRRGGTTANRGISLSREDVVPRTRIVSLEGSRALSGMKPYRRGEDKKGEHGGGEGRGKFGLLM